MPAPVVHFEIIGKDPRALGAFYASAFGWDVDTDHPVAGAGGTEYLMVRPDGEQPPKAGINGGFGAAMEGYDGHVTFYVWVPSVSEALDKVESLGGSRVMGPEQTGGPVIALFADPQGNVIGLVEGEP